MMEHLIGFVIGVSLAALFTGAAWFLFWRVKGFLAGLGARDLGSITDD